MGANHTPLSGDFREDDVRRAFVREGLAPHQWSNGPGDVYGAHSHAYHKVLYCLRGSITFRLTATGEHIELHPGDRLDLEPGAEHAAVVGPRGVTCIEAPRHK
jgi:quercetin dioxygenase-like cupin family protein